MRNGTSKYAYYREFDRDVIDAVYNGIADTRTKELFLKRWHVNVYNGLVLSKLEGNEKEEFEVCSQKFEVLLQECQKLKEQGYTYKQMLQAMEQKRSNVKKVHIYKNINEVAKKYNAELNSLINYVRKNHQKFYIFNALYGVIEDEKLSIQEIKTVYQCSEKDIAKHLAHSYLLIEKAIIDKQINYSNNDPFFLNLPESFLSYFNNSKEILPDYKEYMRYHGEYKQFYYVFFKIYPDMKLNYSVKLTKKEKELFNSTIEEFVINVNEYHKEQEKVRKQQEREEKRLIPKHKENFIFSEFDLSILPYLTEEELSKLILMLAKKDGNYVDMLNQSIYMENLLSLLTPKERAYIYLRLKSYTNPELTDEKIAQVLDVEKEYLDDYQIMTNNNYVNALNKCLKK